jgi:hypothetical protein
VTRAHSSHNPAHSVTRCVAFPTKSPTVLIYIAPSMYFVDLYFTSISNKIEIEMIIFLKLNSRVKKMIDGAAPE